MIVFIFAPILRASTLMVLIRPLVEESWPVTSFFARQLRQDLLRQLLAQLHPHLVEGVDVPDHPLGEDLVLVQRDQRTQHLRGQLGIQEGVGRPVAGEGLWPAPAARAARRCSLPSPAQRAPRPASCPSSAPRSAPGSWTAGSGGARPAGCGCCAAARKSHGISWVPWWISW